MIVEQRLHIRPNSIGARLASHIDPLLPVDVERHADVVEKPFSQKFDVPGRQYGEVGLNGVLAAELTSEHVLFDERELLIKFERDKERLTPMPNEIYVFNRELSDAALDVLE